MSCVCQQCYVCTILALSLAVENVDTGRDKALGTLVILKSERENNERNY